MTIIHLMPPPLIMFLLTTASQLQYFLLHNFQWRIETSYTTDLWEDVVDIFNIFCNQWNVISIISVTNYVFKLLCIYNLRLTNINCFLVWEFLTFNLTSINNSKRWKFANRSLLNIYKDFSIWILSATSLMDLMGGGGGLWTWVKYVDCLQYFPRAAQVKTGLNNEYIPLVSIILMSSIAPNPPSLASRRFYQSFSVLFLLWYVNIRNCAGQANRRMGTWHFGLLNVLTIGTVIA